MSTPATVLRAQTLLAARPAPQLRLAALDDAAADLRAAWPATGVLEQQRAYVVALRVIDLAMRERTHAEHAIMAAQRQQQTRAAGRQRAALAEGIDARAVRAWAREHGIPCPARGRYLPADVLEQYQAAQTRG